MFAIFDKENTDKVYFLDENRETLAFTISADSRFDESDIVQLDNDRIEQGFDGAWYLKGKAPTPPSEWLIERFRSAIQTWMDGEAVKLGYDSVLSACSYINTGNPKFDAEGEGFRQWRSAVWERGYQLIDEVIAGQREVPDDPADVIALLPELFIQYPEA